MPTGQKSDLSEEIEAKCCDQAAGDDALQILRRLWRVGFEFQMPSMLVNCAISLSRH